MSVHIFYLLPLRVPRSNDIPVAINKSNAQILVSEYHSPQKDP